MVAARAELVFFLWEIDLSCGKFGNQRYVVRIEVGDKKKKSKKISVEFGYQLENVRRLYVKCERRF